MQLSSKVLTFNNVNFKNDSKSFLYIFSTVIVYFFYNSVDNVIKGRVKTKIKLFFFFLTKK